ncbi:hypothetical protein EDB92DRAFT_106374 [Lactarius akahatsu]|uniref:BTB domain-containing protein n=1 Tax=Lactarius akahatsu TaxID=416441 RepID=A0AAD4QFV2_9AGAM|nr:hypothetical protein EDB92DRAFT_106374 [Lactarius akahatsu]
MIQYRGFASTALVRNLKEPLALDVINLVRHDASHGPCVDFEHTLDPCLFMATITPDSPSPRADPLADPDPVEPANVLFDDPEADVVLRSRDSHTFRVLKLYIIRSSTVLDDLIRAASDSFGTANVSNNGGLPEVQLSDSSTILSSLLSFIFPIPPVLPSTLEETMELLSVAQKYEMSTVLTHIRGSLALQDLPFICKENAFLAYSVARRYGLRKEAIQAARLTLKFTPMIESPEFGVIPGTHLHELWNYHKTVRAQLLSDLSLPGAAAAFNATLNGLKCTRRTWIQTYVRSIIDSPSLFDPIEFQMALARHTTNKIDSSWNSVVGCPHCTNIPVETMRTFWKALASTVHRCMETIESELSILGTEMGSENRIGSHATHLPLPECLDTGEADIIVRTSDLVDFLVHKSVLATSSSVFRDMFTLPNLSKDGTTDGLPVVDISEDAELVRSLITILYPIPSELPASYDKTLALLAAAQKYEMDAVQSSIRAEVACGPSPILDGMQVFRAYAIASSSGLRPEMEMAARLTLDQPMTFDHLGDELRLFEGRALRELSSFREQCRDNLALCFKSFLDIDSGPSKIWVGCPGHKTEQLDSARNIFGRGRERRGPGHSSGSWNGSDEPKETAPVLPPWLHDLFTREIGELKHAFTRPFIKPSSIRGKYLEALQSHSSPDLCTFCVRVYVMKGEWYCVQLEQALVHSREKASTMFSL